VIKNILRTCLYCSVLGAAAISFLGSLSFSVGQTIQHVAELRSSSGAVKLRPSYIAATPILTVRDLDAVQRVSVTGEGRAAQAQMGVATIDPVTTGSVPDQTAARNPNLFRVSVNGLNMREGPNKATSKIDVLGLGELVEIAETQRSWVRVVRADGRGGWIYSKYLVPVE
jgi:uncharacterized protein YgiM (DUF1202 family)